MLALLVHAAFFALLIFGITWQAKEPEGVVVDLWSDLPAPETKPVIKRVEPPPPAPEPVKKVIPKPVLAKPDIALKMQKLEKEKPKPAPPKVDQAKLEQERREKALQDILEKKRQLDAEQAQRARTQHAATQKSIVDDYTGRIQSKIRSKLNNTVCGDGKPLLIFDIALLPTGQLRGNPVLRKGSGLAACDKAVENAILLSDPLPVPPQPEVFSEFRNTELKFRPNE